MKTAQELEQKAIATHDSLLLAEAWYLYGKMYVLAGDYRSAHGYFVKALRIQETQGDSKELSRLYIRLSETEASQEHLNEAFHFAKQALAIAQRIKEPIALIRAYGTLGQLYERHWGTQLATDPKKITRVLTYYRKVEALCYQTHDSLGVAEASMQLGTVYLLINPSQAAIYFKKAAYLYDLKHKEGIKMRAVISLAKAYELAGKTTQAFHILTMVERQYTSRHLDDFNLLLEIESLYVRLYQVEQRWKLAFEHLNQLKSLERKVLLGNSEGAMSRLNLQYETQKKEALLNAQSRELNLRAESLRAQHRFTITLGVLLIVTALMSVVFFRLYRKNRHISHRNQELVKEQNHRVKNNLQQVASMLNLQAVQLTDQAARQAIEESLLRVQSISILHHKLYDGEHLAKVDLEEFIPELVSSVFQTFGITNIDPDYRLDSVYLSADKATPLGLIINELVTNACKYAFAGQSTAVFRVICRQSGRTIQLEVGDNGPGLPYDPMITISLDALIRQQGTRFGIALIQSQIVQLKAQGRFESKQEGPEHGTVFFLDFSL